MDDFERELKVSFLDEAAQSLAEVEQCFLSLENDPTNQDNLNKIFRLAHNLKGSSKAVGFMQMGELTHEFETFILKIKNNQLPGTPQVVSFLLRCNDFLVQMVSGLKDNLDQNFQIHELIDMMKNWKEESVEAPPVETSELSQELQSESETTEQVVAVEDVTPIEMDEIEKLLAMNAEQMKSEEGAESVPEKAPAPQLAVVPPLAAPEKKETPLSKASENAATPSSSTKSSLVDDSIRISLSKVENLINYVGEMVILQSVISQQVDKTELHQLKKTVLQISKISKEIQDISMSMRLIPIKSVFQKMQRIVRDTAQTLGKDVGITLIGEETELDKTIIERISDPLVHLVRNSVDHGIEMPEVRKTNGKSSKGQVILKASHESGKLVIEVKDDGAGLDPKKLMKKATEKGILKPGVSLKDKEAFDLIFAPGFSTKEVVTDVSGRGVGMDVVKTNVKDLSGEVNIESSLGQGTVFKITLPLTLSIIEAMIVESSKSKYVMPLNHVHESLRPKQDQIHISTNLGEVLTLRGENLPCYRLADFFGQKPELVTHDMIALIVRTGEKPWALLVDDILQQQQVVTKPLGAELKHLTGVSGSTILGDGKPCLILEPNELLKRKVNRTTGFQPVVGKGSVAV